MNDASMFKSIRFWIAAGLLAVLLGCMILKAARSIPQHPVPESAAAVQTTAVTVTTTVQTEVSAAAAETMPENDTTAMPETTTVTEPEPDASVPEISERKIAELTAKMQKAAQFAPDLIGWIYMADTDIDYPVVQGTDNQYYLHHAPDGSENILGTIFLSYQCAPDFSDNLNILYGHNMQSGMFGDIRRFKEQDEFASHRYGWLLTKEALFRIDFYALAVISAYDELYDIPADSAAWQEALRARSMHYTETEPAADLPVLALSTCAVDFGDARALFTGGLVRIRGISPADTA